MRTKMVGCWQSKSCGQRGNYETDPFFFYICKYQIPFISLHEGSTTIPYNGSCGLNNLVETIYMPK